MNLTLHLPLKSSMMPSDLVPCVIKGLDKANFTILFKFVQSYVETDEDFNGWKISHLVQLPEKGDLSNPKK